MNQIKNLNKDDDRAILKENGEIVSAYYQEKGLIPLDVEEGEFITMIRKKWGGKVRVKAPTEAIKRDRENWLDIDVWYTRIDNNMIADVTRIHLDGIEAFILRQDPRMQKALRRKMKERRRKQLRINKRILQNIKQGLKDDKDYL